jgi:hypothetical protein
MGNRLAIGVVFALIGAAVVVAIVAADMQFKALEARATKFDEFGGIIVKFFTLIIVALFIERVVEVFTKGWRAPGREALEGRIASRTAEVATADPQVKAASDTGRQAVVALVAAGDPQIQLAEGEMRDYRSRTRLYAFTGSTVLGLLIALAGVRALALFFDAGTGVIAGQAWLFTALDVIVTGLLLAGGAEGLHKIVDTFTTWMEETRKGLKK